jgi:hypothetical protein
MVVMESKDIREHREDTVLKDQRESKEKLLSLPLGV